MRNRAIGVRQSRQSMASTLVPGVAFVLWLSVLLPGPLIAQDLNGWLYVGDPTIDSAYSRFTAIASEGGSSQLFGFVVSGPHQQATWVKQFDTLYSNPVQILMDVRCVVMDPDSHRTISIDLGAAHNDSIPCRQGWGTQDYEWHTRSFVSPLSCFPGISGINQIWLSLQFIPYDTTVHAGRGEYLVDNLRFDYGNGDTVRVDMFGDPLVGVDEAGDLPAAFELLQNYPNPFNPSTTIRYGLTGRSHVTLTVFNTLGQPVKTIVGGEQEAGYHEMQFDAGNLASGVYLYVLRAGDYVEAKKLLLVR